MTSQSVAYKGKEVKTCYQIWNDGKLPYMVAHEIVSGSNEQALNVLRANGFDGHFDESGFAALHTVIDFYGVSEKYMKGILTRNRVSRITAPGDVHHPYGMEIELSARMVLALSCVMYAGRNIPADSKVATVFNSIQGTTYYTRAKREMDARQIAEIISDGNDQAEISEDGRVIVSLNGLAKLLALVGNNTAS